MNEISKNQENGDTISLKVSLLIPCKNEENFIAGVLNNVLEQDFPTENLEVFVIDGNSSDKTAEIVKAFSDNYAFINLIHNPEGYVPHGLNKTIPKCSGDVIMRMDSHSTYPSDYISQLTNMLVKLKAGNVGGRWDIQPGGKTATANAIAITNSHPLGIGNAQYRLEGDEPIEADTVPFGCYRKEVFDKVGLFDEDLLRTEDDEFNARALLNGYKIYLIPSVVIKYYARPTLMKMSNMFYQYGLYKPFVYAKLKHITTFRQLVPFIFVLSIIGLAVLGLFSPLFWNLLLILITVYLVTLVIVSTLIAIKRDFFIGIVLLPIVFACIHFSYGWGYLKGVSYLLIGKKPEKVKLSR